MGRRDEAGGERRPEEPLQEGCPGAWYRTVFARSLELYLPTRSGQTTMESPLVTREAPRLVLEAVQQYKHQLGRAEGLYWEMVADGS